MSNIKKLTEEQIREINSLVEKNGFISREEFIMLCEKFSFKPNTFRKKLKENFIPFVYQYLDSILIPYGIKMEKNTLNLNDFLKLGNWRVKVFNNSNILARFNCEKCNKECLYRIGLMISRKYFKEEPYCLVCLKKLISQEEIYRNKLSISIKKAKNTIENKEKVSKQMIENWKDDSFRKKTIQRHVESMKIEENIKKMSDRMKKKWENEEYRKKMSDGMKKTWEKDSHRKKIIDTNIEKFGKKSQAQTDDWFDNNASFKGKEYKMPSGKIIKIQGYEDKAIDVLLEKFKEEELVVGTKNIRLKIGEIYYNDNYGVNHRYFPDIYIIPENKIIEVKSCWTYEKYEEINNIKKQSCLEKKINFEFMIFDVKNRKKIINQFIKKHNVDKIECKNNKFIYFIK